MRHRGTHVNSDATAFGRKFHSVAEKIPNYLLESLCITEHTDGGVGADDHALVLRVRALLQGVIRGHNHVIDIHGCSGVRSRPDTSVVTSSRSSTSAVWLFAFRRMLVAARTWTSGVS